MKDCIGRPVVPSSLFISSSTKHLFISSFSSHLALASHISRHSHPSQWHLPFYPPFTWSPFGEAPPHEHLSNPLTGDGTGTWSHSVPVSRMVEQACRETLTAYTAWHRSPKVWRHVMQLMGTVRETALGAWVFGLLILSSFLPSGHDWSCCVKSILKENLRNVTETVSASEFCAPPSFISH